MFEQTVKKRIRRWLSFVGSVVMVLKVLIEWRLNFILVALIAGEAEDVWDAVEHCIISLDCYNCSWSKSHKHSKTRFTLANNMLLPIFGTSDILKKGECLIGMPSTLNLKTHSLSMISNWLTRFWWWVAVTANFPFKCGRQATKTSSTLTLAQQSFNKWKLNFLKWYGRSWMPLKWATATDSLMS